MPSRHAQSASAIRRSALGYFSIQSTAGPGRPTGVGPERSAAAVTDGEGEMLTNVASAADLSTAAAAPVVQESVKKKSISNRGQVSVFSTASAAESSRHPFVFRGFTPWPRHPAAGSGRVAAHCPGFEMLSFMVM